jgi:parallel beta-helix repeat protein
VRPATAARNAQLDTQHRSLRQHGSLRSHPCTRTAAQTRGEPIGVHCSAFAAVLAFGVRTVAAVVDAVQRGRRRGLVWQCRLWRGGVVRLLRLRQGAAEPKGVLGAGVRAVCSGNRLSGNRLSGNRLSGNRLSGNRLSGNRLSGNRLRAGRRSACGMYGKARLPEAGTGLGSPRPHPHREWVPPLPHLEWGSPVPHPHRALNRHLRPEQRRLTREGDGAHGGRHDWKVSEWGACSLSSA